MGPGSFLEVMRSSPSFAGGMARAACWCSLRSVEALPLDRRGEDVVDGALLVGGRHRRGARAPQGLGPRLEDEDVAAGGEVLVDRPLDVHGPAVVLLDALPHPGELGDLVVDERLHRLALQRLLVGDGPLRLRVDGVEALLLRDGALND